MATKDDRPGLLSKMAMFVRNPTKDWSDLERPQIDQDSGFDKQVLKAMIERKRQNDFIRKREFDQLRKLRSRGVSALAGMGRPSVFQSSMATDPDGRAVTLKKIDEIEAQMSKQWWKGKQDAAAKGAGFPVNKTGPTEQKNPDPIAPAPLTVSQQFDTTATSDLGADSRGPEGADFIATEMGDGMGPAAPAQAKAPAKPMRPAAVCQPGCSVSTKASAASPLPYPIASHLSPARAAASGCSAACASAAASHAGKDAV